MGSVLEAVGEGRQGWHCSDFSQLQETIKSSFSRICDSWSIDCGILRTHKHWLKSFSQLRHFKVSLLYGFSAI